MALRWTSLSAYKAIIGVATSTHEAAYTRALEVAEATVLAVTGRPHLFNDATDKTLYMTGQRSENLVLPRPLVSLTSVHEDADGMFGDGPSAFPVETLLVRGVEFFANAIQASEQNPSMLGRVRQRWCESPGSVKIVGQFGYTAAEMPPDLVEATYNLATIVYGAEADGGVVMSSETIGRYSYTLANSGASGSSVGNGGGKILSDVAAVLSRYKELLL